MNKLIKGDSLEAMRAMDDESIDLIYIDPPYFFESSRKGAFNYNSDFTEDEWRELLVSRLTEAKRVLNDTGIIFASINEDGLILLKTFMHQVFGASNFVENFIWYNPNNIKNNSLTTSTSHEYVLCYAKDKLTISNKTYFRKKKSGVDEVLSIYSSMKALGKTNLEIEKTLKAFYKNKHLDVHNFCNVDDAGIYYKDNLSAPAAKNKKTYDVLHPITNQPCKLPSTGWRFTQESMQGLLSQNRIAFGEDHTIVPSRKNYLYAPQYDEDKRYTVLKSLIEDTSYGKEDLLKLFDEAPFVFPKPVSLIKTLIAMHPKKDIKILDFFAGSGTTGHAVMELNKLDGGTRTFTLVEQMDYAEDITWERLVRAKAKYNYSCTLSFVDMLLQEGETAPKAATSPTHHED